MSEEKRSVLFVDQEKLARDSLQKLQLSLQNSADVSSQRKAIEEVWRIEKQHPGGFKGEVLAEYKALEAQYFVYQGNKQEALSKSLEVFRVHTAEGMSRDRERNTAIATDLVEASLRGRSYQQAFLKGNSYEDYHYSKAVGEALRDHLRAAVQSKDEAKVGALVIGALRAYRTAHRNEGPEANAIITYLQSPEIWNGAGKEFQKYRELVEATKAATLSLPDYERAQKSLLRAMNEDLTGNPVRRGVVEYALELTEFAPPNLERTRELRGAIEKATTSLTHKDLRAEIAFREYTLLPDAERTSARQALVAQGYIKSEAELAEREQRVNGQATQMVVRQGAEAILNMAVEIGQAIFTKQTGQASLGRMTHPKGVRALRPGEELHMRNGFAEIIRSRSPRGFHNPLPPGVTEMPAPQSPGVPKATPAEVVVMPQRPAEEVALPVAVNAGRYAPRLTTRSGPLGQERPVLGDPGDDPTQSPHATGGEYGKTPKKREAAKSTAKKTGAPKEVAPDIEKAADNIGKGSGDKLTRSALKATDEFVATLPEKVGAKDTALRENITKTSEALGKLKEKLEGRIKTLDPKDDDEASLIDSLNRDVARVEALRQTLSEKVAPAKAVQAKRAAPRKQAEAPTKTEKPEKTGKTEEEFSLAKLKGGATFAAKKVASLPEDASDTVLAKISVEARTSAQKAADNLESALKGNADDAKTSGREIGKALGALEERLEKRITALGTSEDDLAVVATRKALQNELDEVKKLRDSVGEKIGEPVVRSAPQPKLKFFIRNDETEITVRNDGENDRFQDQFEAIGRSEKGVSSKIDEYQKLAAQIHTTLKGRLAEQEEFAVEQKDPTRGRVGAEERKELERQRKILADGVKALRDQRKAIEGKLEQLWKESDKEERAREQGKIEQVLRGGGSKPQEAHLDEVAALEREIRAKYDQAKDARTRYHDSGQIDGATAVAEGQIPRPRTRTDLEERENQLKSDLEKVQRQLKTDRDSYQSTQFKKVVDEIERTLNLRERYELFNAAETAKREELKRTEEALKAGAPDDPSHRGESKQERIQRLQTEIANLRSKREEAGRVAVETNFRVRDEEFDRRLGAITSEGENAVTGADPLRVRLRNANQLLEEQEAEFNQATREREKHLSGRKGDEESLDLKIAELWVAKSADKLKRARTTVISLEDQVAKSFISTADTRLQDGLQDEANFKTEADEGARRGVPHLEERARRLGVVRGLVDHYKSIVEGKEAELRDQGAQRKPVGGQAAAPGAGYTLIGPGGDDAGFGFPQIAAGGSTNRQIIPAPATSGGSSQGNAQGKTSAGMGGLRTGELKPDEISWNAQRLDDLRKTVQRAEKDLATREADVQRELSAARLRQEGRDAEAEALRRTPPPVVTMPRGGPIRRLIDNKVLIPKGAMPRHEQALENLRITLRELESAPDPAKVRELIAKIETEGGVLRDEKAGQENALNFRVEVENTLNRLRVRQRVYEVHTPQDRQDESQARGVPVGQIPTGSLKLRYSRGDVRQQYDALSTATNGLNPIVEEDHKRWEPRDSAGKIPVAKEPSPLRAWIPLAVSGASLGANFYESLAVDSTVGEKLAEIRKKIFPKFESEQAKLVGLTIVADGEIEQARNDAQVKDSEARRKASDSQAEISNSFNNILEPQYRSVIRPTLASWVKGLEEALLPLEPEIRKQGKELYFLVRCFRERKETVAEYLTLGELSQALRDPFGRRMIFAIEKMEALSERPVIEAIGGAPESGQAAFDPSKEKFRGLEQFTSHQREFKETLSVLESAQEKVAKTLILAYRARDAEFNIFSDTTKEISNNQFFKAEIQRLEDSKAEINQRILDMRRLTFVAESLKNRSLDPIVAGAIYVELAFRFFGDLSKKDVSELRAAGLSEEDYKKFQSALSHIASAQEAKGALASAPRPSMEGIGRVVEFWLKNKLNVLKEQTAFDADVEEEIRNRSAFWKGLAATKTMVDMGSRVAPTSLPMLRDAKGVELTRRRVIGGSLSGESSNGATDLFQKVAEGSSGANNSLMQFPDWMIEQSHMLGSYQVKGLAVGVLSRVVLGTAAKVSEQTGWYWATQRLGGVFRTGTGYAGAVLAAAPAGYDLLVFERKKGEVISKIEADSLAAADSRNSQLSTLADSLKKNYVSYVSSGTKSDAEIRLNNIEKQLNATKTALAGFSGFQITVAENYQRFIENAYQLDLDVRTKGKIELNLSDAGRRRSGGSSDRPPRFEFPPRAQPQ